MSQKPSTYDRYKRSHNQLEKLREFIRRDNYLVDIIRLGYQRYLLTKLQDGSTNIEPVEDQS